MLSLLSSPFFSSSFPAGLSGFPSLSDLSVDLPSFSDLSVGGFTPPLPFFGPLSFWTARPPGQIPCLAQPYLKTDNSRHSGHCTFSRRSGNLLLILRANPTFQCALIRHSRTINPETKGSSAWTFTFTRTVVSNARLRVWFGPKY